jgi:hypothetical protein
MQTLYRLQTNQPRCPGVLWPVEGLFNCWGRAGVCANTNSGVWILGDPAVSPPNSGSTCLSAAAWPSARFLHSPPRLFQPQADLTVPPFQFRSQVRVASSRTHDTRYHCILPIILLAPLGGLRYVYAPRPLRPDPDANPLHSTPQLRTFVPSTRRRRTRQSLTCLESHLWTAAPRPSLSSI